MQNPNRRNNASTLLSDCYKRPRSRLLASLASHARWLIQGNRYINCRIRRQVLDTLIHIEEKRFLPTDAKFLYEELKSNNAHIRTPSFLLGIDWVDIPEDELTAFLPDRPRFHQVVVPHFLPHTLQWCVFVVSLIDDNIQGYFFGGYDRPTMDPVVQKLRQIFTKKYPGGNFGFICTLEIPLNFTQNTGFAAHCLASLLHHQRNHHVLSEKLMIKFAVEYYSKLKRRHDNWLGHFHLHRATPSSHPFLGIFNPKQCPPIPDLDEVRDAGWEPIDVLGDGNCGYYASVCSLENLSILSLSVNPRLIRQYQTSMRTSIPWQNAIVEFRELFHRLATRLVAQKYTSPESTPEWFYITGAYDEETIASLPDSFICPQLRTQAYFLDSFANDMTDYHMNPYWTALVMAHYFQARVIVITRMTGKETSWSTTTFTYNLDRTGTDDEIIHQQVPFIDRISDFDFKKQATIELLFLGSYERADDKEKGKEGQNTNEEDQNSNEEDQNSNEEECLNIDEREDQNSNQVELLNHFLFLRRVLRFDTPASPETEENHSVSLGEYLTNSSHASSTVYNSAQDQNISDDDNVDISVHVTLVHDDDSDGNTSDDTDLPTDHIPAENEVDGNEANNNDNVSDYNDLDGDYGLHRSPVREDVGVGADDDLFADEDNEPINEPLTEQHDSNRDIDSNRDTDGDNEPYMEINEEFQNLTSEESRKSSSSTYTKKKVHTNQKKQKTTVKKKAHSNQKKQKNTVEKQVAKARKILKKVKNPNALSSTKQSSTPDSTIVPRLKYVPASNRFYQSVYNSETKRYSRQEVVSDTSWIFREYIHEAMTTPDKWIGPPIGDPFDRVPPHHLHTKVPTLYVQLNKPFCLAYSFASCLFYCGFDWQARIMASVAEYYSQFHYDQALLSLKNFMTNLCPLIGRPSIYGRRTKGHGRQRRFLTWESLFSDLSPFPTLIIAVMPNGYMSHAFCVVDDLIFDSLTNHALKLNLDSIKWIFNDENVSIHEAWRYNMKQSPTGTKIEGKYERQVLRHW
jgi:hypothetical protein